MIATMPMLGISVFGSYDYPDSSGEHLEPSWFSFFFFFFFFFFLLSDFGKKWYQGNISTDMDFFFT